MTQQEFDKQLSDILVAGLPSRETYENIGVLYRNLNYEDKKFAHESELLGLWMKANQKEIYKYILEKPTE